MIKEGRAPNSGSCKKRALAGQATGWGLSEHIALHLGALSKELSGGCTIIPTSRGSCYIPCLEHNVQFICIGKTNATTSDGHWKLLRRFPSAIKGLGVGGYMRLLPPESSSNPHSHSFVWKVSRPSTTSPSDPKASEFANG